MVGVVHVDQGTDVVLREIANSLKNESTQIKSSTQSFVEINQFLFEMSAVLEICIPSSKLGFSLRLKHYSAICKIPWCVKPDVKPCDLCAVAWAFFGSDCLITLGYWFLCFTLTALWKMTICSILCTSMTIHHFNIRCVQNMHHIMNIITFHLTARSSNMSNLYNTSQILYFSLITSL